MSEKSGFENLPIGFELEPIEMLLDSKTAQAIAGTIQWQGGLDVDGKGSLPPGLTVFQHAEMMFDAVPDLRAAIWAKSEHEFVKPLKIGQKITIRGKLVEKYMKRGRMYIVGEYETVDRNGEILLKSRETSVYIE
ncbi:MAG: hypothetical protein GY866_33010 [Proteobacteria bacterium]|nr:hypothetical protein [Pseudomonadota bacterium]